MTNIFLVSGYAGAGEPLIPEPFLSYVIIDTRNDVRTSIVLYPSINIHKRISRKRYIALLRHVGFYSTTIDKTKNMENNIKQAVSNHVYPLRAQITNIKLIKIL